MSSFNSIFFPPSLLALGQYAGTKHGFQKKEKKVFSVKLGNLFHCPGESSSLKHITSPVIWGPTYRHKIHFC